MERKLLTGTSFFIILLLAFTVVKDFSVPLTHPNGGDTDFWEYMGYYVYTNISFFQPEHYFLPHIDYTNNQHLYPFGTNHALQGWAMESCLWYASFYKMFGNWGNWLGYYYIFSVLITFWGAYLLLKKEVGFAKSLGVAVLVSLFNFYALQRYPYHFSHVVHHWLTLNLIVDFVLFRRFYMQDNISLRLVLLKMLLLILVLGLEVGYVVGLALSSFTLTLLFALIVLIYHKRLAIFVHFKNYLRRYATEIKTDRSNILLATLILLVGYLYISIIGQLFLEVKSFPQPVLHGNWWTNPLRLLLPMFFSPEPDIYAEFMKDNNEGLVPGMVGWFILGLAIIGSLKLKKKEWVTYMPLLALFLLCTLFHPRMFPTLTVFPWFEYARVPGRSTIIYPTILALIAIPAFEFPTKKIFQLIYGFVILIGTVEFIVNYDFQYKKAVYEYAENFREYMETVKNSPGEAVFDYPFCIVGGNGVGGDENLTPLFTNLAHVSTMQRFHRKKTVGHYYGRLNPAQIEEQVALGWGTLMKTEVDNPLMKQKLSSCLTTFQFAQLQKFIGQNDFAGINLYTDLLPNKNCEAKFIKAFGEPKIISSVPGIGRAIFIQKNPAWFISVDKNRGKSVNFTHF